MSNTNPTTTTGQSTKVNGTNASNITTGTATADKVDAKAGNDTGLGGAGNDWVKGGAGDDNVDGGAGSDRVDGGAGNDRLIYKLAENTGATDTYDGGSGTNRLVLQMTRAEWMMDSVQADVAAFLTYLATASTGTNSSKGFKFSAFDLTVTRVQGLEVWVDGVQLDPRDEAVTAVADKWTTATEHSPVSGNVTTNDAVPDLVRAVETVQAPTKGTLALSSDGSFVYNPGNDFNSLAQGETAQTGFTYKVTDADRDSATAQVTITVTGTNDVPVAVADTGTTKENDSITVNVLANDTDVDTSDTHSLQSVSITKGQGTVAIANNQLQWSPGTSYDYLAVGETATVTIGYTQSDNHNATASSTLTLTVNGTNDVPVANADTAATDENTAITVNVLANDIDVDKSDTHTVKNATLTSGLGTVSVTNNQVQWTPGKAYDSLALGETAQVGIAYTQSDNNGATANSTLAIAVSGRNDAPTVAAALASKASEQDAPYTINLLAGATDVDRGATLKISGFSEPGGKGGWTLTGNTLSINPDHFDDLATGQTEKLNFAFQIVDEHGAAVSQSLALDIEGFTDVPSLYVVASAGAAVNKVNLTITSTPANNERVALDFGKLPTGTVILNAAGQNVSAGLASFTGTQVFTAVLPADVDTKAGLTITVTGMDDVKQKAIGSSSGVIDLVFDHERTVDQVVFGSENQGIWASGPAPMVEWHEYIPLIGGVTRTYENGQWKDTGTGTWTSGDFTLFSADITAAEVKKLALAGPQLALDTAKNVFNATAYTIDKAVQDAWDFAKNTFYGAVNEANRIFNAAVTLADKVFNDTVNAGVQAAIDTAQAIYNTTIDIAAGIRDANITVWGWLGSWVSDSAWNVFNETKRIATDVLNFALDGVNQTADGLRQLAGKVKADAISAAQWVKDTTISGAQWTFNKAEETYNAAKQLVYDAAKKIFDAAQQVFDDTVRALDAIQGETKLEVKGDLHAKVGVQVDFVLDSGSVDTEVKYELGSTLQHNKTTDVLVITPQLINKTTGDAVAFETVSPNAVLKAVLLYDVGAALDVFLDSNLFVNGAPVWDISPGNGIRIGTAVTTDGFRSDFDFAKLKEAGAALLNGISVGQLVLVDFDSTTLEQIEVPFLESLTYGIVTADVGLPTIRTEGKAEAYRGNYFAEGGLLAVDLSELTGTLSNMVNAKLDFSPELRQNLSLPSLQGKTIAQAVDLLAQAFLGTVLDVLDGQSDSTPIFVIDATDSTRTSLLHANFVPDSVIGNTLTANTGKFGFYTGYGESNDVLHVTIDVDQLVAVIVNKVAEAVAAAVSSGATVQVLEAIPDINPLDLSFGIEEILQVVKAPKETADQIKKFFDLEIGFEAADINVESSLLFSQDFTLSVDDVEYQVTLEDGSKFNFAANTKGSLLINNASRHDADRNGVVDYSMKLVPSAMFSNDTELNLKLGYVLDFLQANLAADLKIPLDDLLTVKIPGLPALKINLADVNLGPLLRVTGDLDLASADVFEARFKIDIGSDEVDGSFTTAGNTIITVIGMPEAVA